MERYSRDTLSCKSTATSKKKTINHLGLSLSWHCVSFSAVSTNPRLRARKEHPLTRSPSTPRDLPRLQCERQTRDSSRGFLAKLWLVEQISSRPPSDAAIIIFSAVPYKSYLLFMISINDTAPCMSSTHTHTHCSFSWCHLALWRQSKSNTRLHSNKVLTHTALPTIKVNRNTPRPWSTDVYTSEIRTVYTTITPLVLQGYP